MSAGHCDLCGRWDTQLLDGTGACCRGRLMVRSNWVETQSGNKVSLEYPDPETITLEDIAWALARLPRFNGHTRGDPYSVARHSLWVASYFDISDVPRRVQFGCQPSRLWVAGSLDISDVPPRMPLLGLIHDAHEAYMGDIVSPVARCHPYIQQAVNTLKNRLQSAIYLALQITPPTADEAQALRDVDGMALARESQVFMVSRGDDWNLPTPTSRANNLPINAHPWVFDHVQFLHRFHEYMERLA